jgi:uncharacterized protein YndB with AHSA1/START domain
MTTTLTHRLERTVAIHASRETVFRFFTDESRWAAWWGQGSTIDARPGGQMLIRYPDGTMASGEVIEVLVPERIVFTYGYASGQPIPPGSSRVTIRLEPQGPTTRLHFAHEFADPAVRDEHVQGWRYQLSVFANVVSDEVHAGAAAVADAWFLAWAEPEANARREAFSRIAAPNVAFRDRFSLLEGMTDLVEHTGAAQRFMPGIRLQRHGGIRQCQGTVLADWVARGADGQTRMSGTNVFVFGPDGRIESVTGLMNAESRTENESSNKAR